MISFCFFVLIICRVYSPSTSIYRVSRLSFARELRIWRHVQMIDAARNTKELPRLVGYAELAKVYGWQKRSLQRAVNAGKLRRPMIVAGGRAAWYDTDIKDYLARLGGELEAIAVSDPDKLLPEQIEDAAVELSARLMTNVLGEKVSADDVVIGAVKKLSPADAETVGYTRWLGLWAAIEEHMSTLDHLQSLAVAYGLFPAMRPWLDDIANRGGKRICPPGVPPLDLALCVLAGRDWNAFRDWAQRHKKQFSSAHNRAAGES